MLIKELNSIAVLVDCAIVWRQLNTAWYILAQAPLEVIWTNSPVSRADPNCLIMFVLHIFGVAIVIGIVVVAVTVIKGL